MAALPRQWFAKDPAFDALLRQRFLGLTRRAIAGELDAWAAEPSGGLALVLLLDQFPRQIWRDTAMAFVEQLMWGWACLQLPARFKNRARPCTQDSPDWHHVVEDEA